MAVDDFQSPCSRRKTVVTRSYVWLGRPAFDGRGGVLERYGIGEVAARPGGEDLVSYAVQFGNDAPGRPAR